MVNCCRMTYFIPKDLYNFILLCNYLIIIQIHNIVYNASSFFVMTYKKKNATLSGCTFICHNSLNSRVNQNKLYYWICIQTKIIGRFLSISVFKYAKHYKSPAQTNLLFTMTTKFFK